jgi:hypothetical protein
MATPSAALSPVAPVDEERSEPAKSIRLMLEVKTFLTFPSATSYSFW